MGKITNEMVEKSFEIGKKFYKNKISLKDGIKVLTEIGMNENSAVDYVYNYSNLIQGKLFTRTTNIYGTEYSLQKIYEENGIDRLQNALLSLSQHIDYYEEKSGSSVKKRKEVYNRYLKLINQKPEKTIYPDEVDSETEYSEGKTKKVLVNSYERNPIARKKCIEHFGLNCQVCNFNFEEKFGVLGKKFIHFHHKIDIATIGNEYSVNPLTDLIPVCPNCHSMLHKKKPAYSIEELKIIMK
ncbi:HNH endonuclease [Polaribacter batillariae]|uniref:HNH endonuclease n=1 Tax=Polaribacter batillariae TaxID=2808900 RepID=A0ABX7SVD0_9FLAO|nr:HNH endonuclease [Polaribacter batillariae]QTD38210.1 HNH endonuclease [Polaribacter batillariae]